MHPPETHHKEAESIEARSRRLCEEATLVGKALAHEARRLSYRLGFIRTINVLVGVTVVVVTNFPEAHEAIGNKGARLVVGIGALILVLDTVLPWILRAEEPARLRDFSRYILDYESRLTDTLADEALEPVVRRARLVELNHLTRKNLHDAVSNFEDIVERR